jgi:hypothetical protein
MHGAQGVHEVGEVVEVEGLIWGSSGAHVQHYFAAGAEAFAEDLVGAFVFV